MPIRALGSYGPSTWLLSQAPWNTTNCISGNWRETATMSSGPLWAGSKFTSGKPLCATKIFTPRSCAFWMTGRPIAGSSSEKPWPFGPHAV